jgi:hypothetical protein
VRPPAVLLAAALGGCVTGSFGRYATDEPVPPAALAALRPGADTLASCLSALGAPHQVFEHDVAADGSAGVGLLWVWRDEVGWGLDVSSGDDSVPASVSYDRGRAELPACVLWFDRDLVLQRWRSGPIGELLPGRRRPAADAATTGG